MKTSALLILLLLQFVDPVAAQTPARKIPECTFFKLDGTRFSTNDILPGRASVFIFFDVTCSHCQSSVKTLAANYDKLINSVVYLVTLDRKDAVEKFMSIYGRPFLNKENVRVLQDLQYEFIPKFRPEKYPAMFLYDKHQKLVLHIHDEKKIPDILAKIRILK